MKRRLLLLIAVLSVVALATGCTFPKPPLPVDYGNPLKRIAILPLKNDTADVDGPNVLREKMVQAPENRSYAVQDIKETDQILRDRMGITLGGQLELTTAQKLGETLGVQGVLYGTLIDFDESTVGVYNAKKVRAKFRLVNTATGQPMWQRGLGVKAENRTSGLGGAAVTLGARAADNDKEAPWVIIESSVSNQSAGKTAAMNLGSKWFMQAIGKHLEHESEELARRITDNLPWGPGSGQAPEKPAPPAPAFKLNIEVKTPEPPSFGYMDWEGKKDFHAVIHSVSLNKGDNKSWVMDAPLWITGPKMKMEMDLTKMMQASGGKDSEQSPLSKMTILSRGDKKTGYTLYPNVQKYMVHDEKEGTDEKPHVVKEKVGSETIDGHPCDKFKVTVTYKSEKPQEGFIWNARDLDNMTIRSEVENKDFKVTTELKSIVLKSSPASIFEIPANYTEAKGFMDLMMAGKQQNQK